MVRTVEECQAKMAQCVADYNDVCRVLVRRRGGERGREGVG